MITQLWRFPVKSMQGSPVDAVHVGAAGIEGDRQRAVLDADTGRLLSAKRYSALLLASADDAGITLPEGPTLPYGDPSMDRVLSEWLGRGVRLAEADTATSVQYEMTFEPPNDDAEYVPIPAPPGTFFDWAGVHLLAVQTLAGCASARPELDWDVRRFRPNVVLDEAGLEPFGEDAWCGSQLRLGTGGAVLTARQPTVRCAMPLRGQPGLVRQRELYGALEELHRNHLGIYLAVVSPGPVRVGDEIAVI